VTRIECHYAMSPYRSIEHVLAANRVEQAEIAIFAREARGRRRRAAVALGVVFAGALAGLMVVPPGYRQPALECHHVTLRYEQASGTPPPPLGWTSCVWR
jgi:hypothetical protein